MWPVTPCFFLLGGRGPGFISDHGLRQNKRDRDFLVIDFVCTFFRIPALQTRVHTILPVKSDFAIKGFGASVAMVCNQDN